jgi:hypothetical protein
VAGDTDRTALCAPASEQGEAGEHAEPVPVGEAYNVTAVAADADETGISALTGARSAAAASSRVAMA